MARKSRQWERKTSGYMVSIVRKQSNGCVLSLRSLSSLYCPGSRWGMAPPWLLGLLVSIYKVRRFLDPLPRDSRFPQVDSYHQPSKDYWDFKLDCFIVLVSSEAPEIPKSGRTLEVIEPMRKGEESACRRSISEERERESHRPWQGVHTVADKGVRCKRWRIKNASQRSWYQLTLWAKAIKGKARGRCRKAMSCGTESAASEFQGKEWPEPNSNGLLSQGQLLAQQIRLMLK